MSIFIQLRFTMCCSIYTDFCRQAGGWLTYSSTVRPRSNYIVQGLSIFPLEGDKMADKILFERLQVPASPIIPYIQGDGIGVDIWKNAFWSLINLERWPENVEILATGKSRPDG